MIGLLQLKTKTKRTPN